MINQQQEKLQLWRKIGLNNSHEIQAHQVSLSQFMQEGQGLSSSLDAAPSKYSKQKYNFQSVATPSSSIIKQHPFIQVSTPIQRIKRETQDQDIFLNSLKQNLERNNQSVDKFSGSQEMQQVYPITTSLLDQTSNYVYEMGNKQIQSITPLIYSKNSHKTQLVHFRKETAKCIILRMHLEESRELLLRLRSDISYFIQKIYQQHQALRNQIYEKCFSLEKEYSARLQESKFLQKQEYQQLRYQFEILKAKEGAMFTNVNSQLIVQRATDINHYVNKSYQNLQQQLAVSNQLNKKLMVQVEKFKRQIQEIESKTYEIRQSNDKLYEYIFDLEQKIAFHKEEVPKIENEIRQELGQKMILELETLHKKSKQQSQYKLEHAQSFEKEIQRLKSELAKERASISNYLSEADQMKASKCKLEDLNLSLKRELDAKIAELQDKCQEIGRLTLEKIALQRNIASGDDNIKRITKQQRLRQYQIRQDKKYIEQLQICKLVLQKQNLQLRATIQFYNKNPNRSYGYSQNLAYHETLQFRERENEEIVRLKEKQRIQMKEQELLELQKNISAESRKLDYKQREISSEYIIKKTQDHYGTLGYTKSQQCIPNDDYGMKAVSIIPNRGQTFQQPQRKNNFCSSQAQAIIDKVKLRQKLRKDGCHCDDFQHCRCQYNSKNSRDSNGSESRDRWRMQYYRPEKSSNKVQEYYLKHDKNSKMKQIEDKVRRLKSQLKTSLSAMKNQ